MGLWPAQRGFWTTAGHALWRFLGHVDIPANISTALTSSGGFVFVHTYHTSPRPGSIWFSSSRAETIADLRRPTLRNLLDCIGLLQIIHIMHRPTMRQLLVSDVLRRNNSCSASSCAETAVGLTRPAALKNSGHEVSLTWHHGSD